MLFNLIIYAVPSIKTRKTSLIINAVVIITKPEKMNVHIGFKWLNKNALLWLLMVTLKFYLHQLVYIRALKNIIVSINKND